MKSLQLLCAGFVLILMTACGNNSNGNSSDGVYSTNNPDVLIVDSAGYCTHDAIDANNQLIMDIQSYDVKKNTEHLHSFRKSCTDFRDLMGSTPCIAKNFHTQESLTDSQ
jgi:hypothetical protein